MKANNLRRRRNGSLRVLFAGGGTGGHLVPVLNLIKAVKEKYANVSIFYCGAERGVEKDVVPGIGIDYALMSIRPFERELNLGNLLLPFNILSNLFKSWKILSTFKPDILVGTGGYVSGPILLMGAMRGVPTLILEENIYPGATTKLLSKFVDEVHCHFEKTLRYLHVNGKGFVTGNPVKKPKYDVSTDEIYESLGLTKQLPIILVTGGSQGAHAINLLALGMLKTYKGNNIPFQLILQTGQKDFSWLETEVTNITSKAIVKPFFENLTSFYPVTDLIICRAGAMTVAEITAWGLPSILIPYPYAAKNHQEENALLLVEKGAAMMFNERQLTAETLRNMVEELLSNKEKRNRMAEVAKQLGKPDATDALVERIVTLAKGSR